MIPLASPKQLKALLKRFGVKAEEVEAECVLIKGVEKEIRVEKPHVLRISFQGQQVFQVMGEVNEKPLAARFEVSEEDVRLVAERAGVSEAEARKALEECEGNLAEAILKLRG